MMFTDFTQVLIKSVALVLILAPFGGALDVDGGWPCIGITAICVVQQWQHRQLQKGRVTP